MTSLGHYLSVVYLGGEKIVFLRFGFSDGMSLSFDLGNYSEETVRGGLGVWTET